MERLLQPPAERSALLARRCARCRGRDEECEDDRDGGAGTNGHHGSIVRTGPEGVKHPDRRYGSIGPRRWASRPLWRTAGPPDGAGAPTLARLEDTLTDGYAQALALEAERLRLERRLGEVAREADGGDPSRLSAELTLLASRLTRADGELAKLRALLGSLVERTRTQRRLAAQN
jgi:hypothetical protein